MAGPHPRYGWGLCISTRKGKQNQNLKIDFPLASAQQVNGGSPLAEVFPNGRVILDESTDPTRTCLIFSQYFIKPNISTDSLVIGMFARRKHGRTPWIIDPAKKYMRKDGAYGASSVRQDFVFVHSV